MRFNDRVVIVTGAARGIGRALATAFAREGARVVLADIEDASAVAKDLAEAGGQARSVRCDVSARADAEACAREAVNAFGRIDVLVNNAAIYGGLKPNAFEHIPEDEWDRVMAVNVKGVWFMSAAVAGTMRAQGYGRIVNMSSGVALSGPPFFLQYVTSKAAVLGITRALARELGDSGITVNAVTPGVVWTEATEGVVSAMGMDKEAFMSTVLPQMCVKRPQLPEDLVGTVLFLASEEAAMVTGQVVNVDGGINFY